MKMPITVVDLRAGWDLPRPVGSGGWDLTRPVGISPVRLGSVPVAPYSLWAGSEQSVSGHAVGGRPVGGRGRH